MTSRAHRRQVPACRLRTACPARVVGTGLAAVFGIASMLGCAAIDAALHTLDKDKSITVWERWCLVDKLPMALLWPFGLAIAFGDDEEPLNGGVVLVTLPIMLAAWPIVEVYECATGHGPWSWRQPN